jgi:hypothetical protein
MAPQRVAKRTAYYNADKTKLVKEGDPEAAFLFVREGSALRHPEEAERLKYSTFEEVDVYDAVADHTVKHGGETQAEADQKRAAMLAGVPDPDGPAVEGERGEKAQTPTATKAVSKAPANK